MDGSEDEVININGVDDYTSHQMMMTMTTLIVSQVKKVTLNLYDDLFCASKLINTWYF